MFVKILYFLLFTSLGIAVLKYRKNVYEWTGQWYWAEKYVGRGGTLTVITLIGLGLLFFGVGYPLGAFDTFKDHANAPASETSSTPPSGEASDN